MTLLVADVGGTNTRFAFCDSALISTSLHRIANCDVDSFDAALEGYLQMHGNPRPDALCIAVAGPVSAGRADLTNRGWRFDAADLSRRFGARAMILNDLAALGHAVPNLPQASVAPVWEPETALRVFNGQALVVGLGTGMNACAVRFIPGHPVACVETEFGQTALNGTIIDELARRLGGAVPAAFFSTEELFSGRGLARLHETLSGAPTDSTEFLAQLQAGVAEINATWETFATLAGLLARELALTYLPREGLYLAGAVARGLIEAGFGPTFTNAFTAPQKFRQIVAGVPVRLITDDMAALIGCHAAARENRP